MLMTHVCNHVLYCLIKPYCSLSSLMQDRHEKGAMFVNVRKYNGFYVFSLIYPRSCRIIHQKPRRTNCPCFYYANSSTSRQTLLRGGDISVNPGSLAKQKSAEVRLHSKINLFPIGHLHDEGILLLLPEYFSILLSCAN